jgi:hypothetical protein
LGVSGRRLIALLALPVSLLAGCGGSDDEGATSTAAVKGLPARAAAIAGDWRGTLEQKGLAHFQIGVRIDPSGTARVAYTGIDCAGVWEPGRFVSFQSHYFAFTERINRGAGGECKGTGRVKAYLDLTTGEGKLHYRFAGGGVRSRGVLTRTDAAGLAPVFRQAGIEPPD